MRSRLQWLALSPLTPRWISHQLVQLVALVLAAGALALILAAASPAPTDAPAPLHTTDSRIVEPMGHGGPR